MVVGVVSLVLAIHGVHYFTEKVRTVLAWIGAISIVLFVAVLVFIVTHFK